MADFTDFEIFFYYRFVLMSACGEVYRWTNHFKFPLSAGMLSNWLTLGLITLFIW